MTDAQDAVSLAYKLESLLTILSLATDGEQIAGKTFEQCGGGTVIGMAIEMMRELVGHLEGNEARARKGADQAMV